MEFLKYFLLCAVFFSVSESRNHNSNYDSKKTIVLNLQVDYDKNAVDLIRKIHLNATKKQIQKITQQLIEETQRLFNNSVFDVKIELNLLKTKFLKRNTFLINSKRSASIYLQTYCEWQKGIKEKVGMKYYSVLLTGKNIYTQKLNRRNYDQEGLSYRNSYCSASMSCSLIEWQEHNLAFSLAHEIGHSLGMHHDSATGQCDPHYSIMTARFKNSTHFLPYKFTKCNAADLRSFLQSPLADCLV